MRIKGLNISGVKNSFFVAMVSVMLSLIVGCGSSDTENVELQVENPERVVITVGEEVVTLKEFDGSLKRLLSGGVDVIPEEDLMELKNNLLNQMVEEMLILEEAGRLDLNVTTTELKAEIGSIEGGYGDTEFEAAILERYRDMDTWRAEIRKKLLIKKTIETAVNSTVQVDEAELKKYFDENKAEYDMPEQVRALMIVVVDEKAAEAARARLATGEDFSTLAREVSSGPEATSGGDLGFFARGDMPPEFEDAVFKLSKGETSGVVKSSYGYHIFKLTDKKAGRKLGFKDAKKSIAEKLKRVKAEAEYGRWMRGLKDKANIDVDWGIL